MNNAPIIKLFEDNELNISNLYSLYAQKIPGKHAFWDKISKEEIAHAVEIGSKMNYAENIIENKFSRGIIKYIMDFVLKEIEKTQQSKISHKEALQTALRIERSMLEKKCFEMFTPTHEKVQAVFNKLNKDSERHVALLLSEIEKNGFDLKESKK
ncbi:MAG: hypothetical protein PHP62_03050 [Candidatus Moranbacteria bacterium]|nr:hypothetical protein [Candidatus Moranbacteria bacterium]